MSTAETTGGPPKTGPDTPDTHNLPTQSPVSLPRILSGSEYLALPRAPETWLVEPLLPTGGSLLLYGDPKVGKSYAALQLACSMASGEPWLGMFRVGQGTDTASMWQGRPQAPSNRVVYIQLDTPRSLWAERIATLRLSGLPTDLVYFADRETLDVWPFDIRNPMHQDILACSLQEISPACVIVDTLRECCTGADENDSTEMQEVVAHLTSVVNPAALVLVSHAKKPTSDGYTSTINDMRGSSYVPGKMDGIVRFTHSGISVAGRAVEEMDVKLERASNFTWRLADREIAKQTARELLTDSRFPTLRSKARRLADLTGKTEEASLSLLHRLSSSVLFHEGGETEH